MALNKEWTKPPVVTDEQKIIADEIKRVHEDLRKSAEKFGAFDAWEKHLQNEDSLRTYARNMRNLAQFWEENATKPGSAVISRIKWITEFCTSYFLSEKLYLTKREKELKIVEYLNEHNKNQINLQDDSFLNLEKSGKIRLLDVGSCYNPFKSMDIFDVLGLDLCPAVDSVYKCDFLKVNIDNNLLTRENEVIQLPFEYFHCVVFSLLLEYLPSSEQRMECCKKAYEILKFEGILIVITPDSQNVGKNAKLMKNWRYTLGLLGFSRIKFEKLPHITCMVFRKSLTKSVAEQWSKEHEETYMKFKIEIPQTDKEINSSETESTINEKK